MVETHKRKRKNTVITKITLTISNAKHIKQTLSTNKPYRHQQHLPKISQNVSGLELYGWQFDIEIRLISPCKLLLRSPDVYFASVPFFFLSLTDRLISRTGERCLVKNITGLVVGLTFKIRSDISPNPGVNFTGRIGRWNITPWKFGWDIVLHLRAHAAAPRQKHIRCWVVRWTWNRDSDCHYAHSWPNF